MSGMTLFSLGRVVLLSVMGLTSRDVICYLVGMVKMFLTFE